MTLFNYQNWFFFFQKSRKRVDLNKKVLNRDEGDEEAHPNCIDEEVEPAGMFPRCINSSCSLNFDPIWLRESQSDVEATVPFNQI